MIGAKCLLAEAASTAIQAGGLAIGVLIIERTLGTILPSRVRSALWWAVIFRLLLPSDLGLICRPTVVVLPLPTNGFEASAIESVPLPWLIWGIGGLVFASAAAWRARRVATQWRGGPKQPSMPRVTALAGTAARRLGLCRLPRIEIRNGAPGPAVLGILRPCVILPAEFAASASDEELLHVLMHEYAHVQRRDPWTAAFTLLIQILWWFHPAAWIARSRLSCLRELGCDDHVALALGPEAVRYRRTLLCLSKKLLAAPMGFLGRRSRILERLDSLRHPRKRRRRIEILWSSLLLVGLLACSGGGESEPWPESDSWRVAFDHPPVGCLQKRMLVYHLLAEEAAQSHR